MPVTDTEKLLLSFDERPAETQAEVAVLRRPLTRDHRVPAVERAVVEAEPRLSAQRTHPGLRDDVDEEAEGRVVLGGERVARDVDRLDLRLGRQLLPLERIDADRRVGAGEALELAGHLVRVFRECLHLLARQRRPERPRAVRGRGLLVAPHRHVLGEPGERQHHQVLVVAGLEADVAQQPHLEARELPLQRVTAGHQVLEGGDAPCRTTSPARSVAFLVASSRPMTETVAFGITAPV